MKFSPGLSLLSVCGYAAFANGYWLMGINNFITTQRLDPIVNPGAVAGHAHAVLGGSNFGMTTDTDKLLKSECTSIPINEDHSNYWFPQLYFQWANGSFSSVSGGAVVYYLFDDKPGATTAFPPNLRMLSGTPALRSYDPNSHAQQAITFLCLDFNGVTTRHNEFPTKKCPSGIRSQVNFPSCWDGKNTDSPDHKSHVAFKSGGPDSGTCSDPKYPVTIPRIFLEVYWGTGYFNDIASQAKDPQQPFVFSYGDPTGYGYHADFLNGWQPGVLQRAVDGCTCNMYGDPTCCVEKGLFTMDKDKKCFITNTVDEQVLGTLPKLPGNNPVQGAGPNAVTYPPTSTPALLSPVYVYHDENKPPAPGKVVTPAVNGGAPAASAAPTKAPATAAAPAGSTNNAHASPASSSPVANAAPTVTKGAPAYPPPVKSTPTGTKVSPASQLPVKGAPTVTKAAPVKGSPLGTKAPVAAPPAQAHPTPAKGAPAVVPPAQVPHGGPKESAPGKVLTGTCHSAPDKPKPKPNTYGYKRYASRHAARYQSRMTF